MIKNKITLSGFAGTGKSTVVKILAKRLSCDFVSVGDFSRKYAQEHFGLSINEFQEKCKKEPELDDLIDEKFKQFCNEKDIIVADYRLGFHFIKNAFHVLLKVSDEVAVSRIQKANREKEDISIDSIKKRNQEMKQRFLDKYGIDFTNEDNYDLVIDTDALSPEDVADIIIFHMTTEQRIIDLSSPNFYENYPNYPIGMFNGDEEKFKNYRPRDNKFGWDVSYAEIYIDKQTKELVEYRLLSQDKKEQCHASKVTTENLDYWHFEFLSREYYFSPVPFEPNLETFVEYYYQDIFKNKELLIKDLSLPIVSYEISSNQKIMRVRYALFANKSHSEPLIDVSVKNNNIQAITDWQTLEMKNVVYPTPDHSNEYSVQKSGTKSGKSIHHSEPINDSTEKTLKFSGFNDYEIKYLFNSDVEKELRKYGFFIPELRNIINDSEMLLKYIPTVNYHLIKLCNMHCKHCFSDYGEIKIPKLEFDKAKQIIQEISKVKSFKKLNFSGGEPTMFKEIEKLVKFAKEQGLETSMVTNGYELIKSPKLLDTLKGNLDLLALSIDSFDAKLNLKIGRYVDKQTKTTISYEEFLGFSKRCEEYNIKIKVNTVVTKLNYNQILADKIAAFKPIRWKILRMLPVKSQNDEAEEYIPTDEEYNIFIDNNKEMAKHKEIKVVTEDNEDMTGSYLMISPDGRFFNNVERCLKYSEPILSVGIVEALRQTPLLRETFYKREGDYSWD
jgi:predicted cytidylate kinase